MKAVLFLVYGLIVAGGSNALAASAGDETLKSVLGTYECNDGSTAILAGANPAEVEKYTPSSPLVRLSIVATNAGSKVGLLWWNRDKRDWKEDPSAYLIVKQFESNENSWSVVFEGSFGDRLAAAVSGYLSWFADFKGLHDKPILVLTQTSPFFASASALNCDKL